MAVALRNINTATEVAGGGTLDLTKPTGTVAGDVLLVGITLSGSTTVVTLSGWTLVEVSGAGDRGYTFRKVAGASEPASYSFDTVGAHNGMVGAILAYSGASITSPIAANDESNESGNGSSSIAPSLTVDASGVMLVCFWMHGDGATTTPGTMTERADLANPAGSRRIVVADQLITPGTTSTGTRTATHSSTDDRWSHSIAITSLSSVTLAAIGPASTIGAIAVQPDKFITLAAIGPSSAVGAITVSPPSKQITLAEIAPTSTVGAIEITQTAPQVTLAAIGPSSVVGAITIAPQSVGITLAAIGPSSTVGAISVQAIYNITLASVGPTSAVGSITVIPGTATVTLAPIGPTSNVGAIVVTSTYYITLAAIGPSSVVGAIVVSPQAVVARSSRTVLYRVVIADLNGVELEEVPFKNLQFSFALNDSGSCSFALPILHDKTTKSLLDPGKREIHVYRETDLLWGGYLWSAFPNTGDHEVRFAGEGWFSRLKYRYIDADHIKVDEDQLDIAWSLINFTQSKTDGDLGITRFDPGEASGVLRTRRYHEWERYNIGEELISLTEVANGFDFEITPEREWKTYFPGKGAVTDVVFDLDKNIGALDLQYDATDVVSEFTALGSGDRRNRCIVTVADASVSAAFGLLQGHDSWSGIKHYDTLAQKALGQLNTRKKLKKTPQMSVLTDEPMFNDYVCGDQVRIRAHHGYIDLDELFRVTAQVIQIADSGRESQTVFLEEVA